MATKKQEEQKEECFLFLPEFIESSRKVSCAIDCVNAIRGDSIIVNIYRIYFTKKKNKLNSLFWDKVAAKYPKTRYGRWTVVNEFIERAKN